MKEPNNDVPTSCYTTGNSNVSIEEPTDQSTVLLYHFPRIITLFRPKWRRKIMDNDDFIKTQYQINMSFIETYSYRAAHTPFIIIVISTVISIIVWFTLKFCLQHKKTNNRSYHKKVLSGNSSNLAISPHDSHYQLPRRIKDRTDSSNRFEIGETTSTDPSTISNRKNHKRRMIDMKIEFLNRVGNRYGYMDSPGGHIDSWRSFEFPSLIDPISIKLLENNNGDEQDEEVAPNDDTDLNPKQQEKEVYLDYAGAAIPSQSQMNEIMQLSQSLGNPHSTGPAAYRTKQYMEQVKQRILDHFHAHPTSLIQAAHQKPNIISSNSDDVDNQHPGYEIVFTSGTTEAIRIVAQRFPWCCGIDDDGDDGDGDGNEISISSSLLVYAQNSHTSIIGMREELPRRSTQHKQKKKKKGANFVGCLPAHELIEKIIQHRGTIEDLNNEFRNQSMSSSVSDFTTTASPNAEDVNNKATNDYCHKCNDNDTKHLLVVPLECNFGGDRFDSVEMAFQKLYDLDAISVTCTKETNCLCNCQQPPKRQQRWYTMLDIAKAASTGPINLCQLNPDFACLSFYKMFGEPTGLGCLFVKRTAIDVLFQSISTASNCINNSCRHPIKTVKQPRSYVGGGSVNIIVPGKDYTVPRSDPTTLVSLTNGTPHFRGISALLAGFHEFERVGGINRIREHAVCLAHEFVQRLQALRHRNGLYVVELYGNWKNDLNGKYTAGQSQSGPTVAFNLIRGDGSYVGYNELSKLAALNSPPIQIRTGCFCNPGACQIALNISDEHLIRNYEMSGHVCGDPIDIIHNRPTGAVRVSFGKDSIWEDMHSFILFLEQVFVNYDIDSKNDSLGNEKGPTKAEITELYIFPIKSCAAQRVSEWQIDSSTGRLRFDREFALIDSSGAAMRLQMYPSMSLLRPIIDLDAFTLIVKPPDNSCAELILSLNDGSLHGAKQACNVNVCGNRCAGLLWGDRAVSDWFSRYLGVQCWLARHSGDRDDEYSYAFDDSAHVSRPERSSLSFANEQPILLISEYAVRILNDEMQKIVEGARRKGAQRVNSKQFRPNIVVRTTGDTKQHIEDTWKKINLIETKHQKGMTFDVAGPCARCAMVDVNPSNGNKVNTLRALAGYRRGGNGQITFGIFLRASESETLNHHGSKWLKIYEGSILFCS